MKKLLFLITVFMGCPVKCLFTAAETQKGLTQKSLSEKGFGAKNKRSVLAWLKKHVIPVSFAGVTLIGLGVCFFRADGRPGNVVAAAAGDSLDGLTIEGLIEMIKFMDKLLEESLESTFVGSEILLEEIKSFMRLQRNSLLIKEQQAPGYQHDVHNSGYSAAQKEVNLCVDFYQTLLPASLKSKMEFFQDQKTKCVAQLQGLREDELKAFARYLKTPTVAENVFFLEALALALSDGSVQSIEIDEENHSSGCREVHGRPLRLLLTKKNGDVTGSFHIDDTAYVEQMKELITAQQAIAFAAYNRRSGITA